MTSEDQKILFEKLGKQMNYTLGLPNFKLINDVIYKLCTKCKKYKPMTSKFFPRRNNVKCGYGSHCKECEKEKESKRIRIPSFNENGKCALSNLEMQTVIKAGKNPFNVSIDRIKPGRAYSLSNIRLVCNSINTMRSNLSDEEFLSFCKAVVDYLSI